MTENFVQISADRPPVRLLPSASYEFQPRQQPLPGPEQRWYGFSAVRCRGPLTTCVRVPRGSPGPRLPRVATSLHDPFSQQHICLRGSDGVLLHTIPSEYTATSSIDAVTLSTPGAPVRSCGPTPAELACLYSRRNSQIWMLCAHGTLGGESNKRLFALCAAPAVSRPSSQPGCAFARPLCVSAGDRTPYPSVRAAPPFS